MKWRGDTHHTTALTLFDRHPEAEVLWTPWQRVEVLNGFRQVERTGLSRRGESRRMIRLLEKEVRLGYWAHVEFDLTDAVRTACELGAEHTLKLVVRAMDLFDVAVAIEAAADAFLSFFQFFESRMHFTAIEEFDEDEPCHNSVPDPVSSVV